MSAAGVDAVPVDGAQMDVWDCIAEADGVTAGVPVDLAVLHRVCALANAAGTGRLAEVCGYLSVMVERDPARLVTVVALLAVAAGESAATPQRVLESAEGLLGELDFGPVARAGVAMYTAFQRRGELLVLPGWAQVATRLYGRLRGRRQRARRAGAG